MGLEVVEVSVLICVRLCIGGRLLGDIGLFQVTEVVCQERRIGEYPQTSRIGCPTHLWVASTKFDVGKVQRNLTISFTVLKMSHFAFVSPTFKPLRTLTSNMRCCLGPADWVVVVLLWMYARCLSGADGSMTR